jgi:hypothetical protein
LSAFFIAWTNQEFQNLKLNHHKTLAAERQDPDFLIGPRNKKKPKKKGRPLKFFIHRSKLQAGISDAIQHTDAGACLRLFLPLHSRVFAAPIDRNMRLWSWNTLSRQLIEILCDHHHQKFRLVTWTGG